jgi:hypothetical protein
MSAIKETKSSTTDDNNVHSPGISVSNSLTSPTGSSSRRNEVVSPLLYCESSDSASASKNYTIADRIESLKASGIQSASFTLTPKSLLRRDSEDKGLSNDSDQGSKSKATTGDSKIRDVLPTSDSASFDLSLNNVSELLFFHFLNSMIVSLSLD